MARIILKEVAKIDIIVKNCCRILVLAVMVTDQQSFLAFSNTVPTVNVCWPVVILSAALLK